MCVYVSVCVCECDFMCVCVCEIMPLIVTDTSDAELLPNPFPAEQLQIPLCNVAFSDDFLTVNSLPTHRYVVNAIRT